MSNGTIFPIFPIFPDLPGAGGWGWGFDSGAGLRFSPQIGDGLIFGHAEFDVGRIEQAGINARGAVKVLNWERSAHGIFGFRIEPERPHSDKAVPARGEIQSVAVGRTLRLVVLVFASGEFVPPVRPGRSEVPHRRDVHGRLSAADDHFLDAGENGRSQTQTTGATTRRQDGPDPQKSLPRSQLNRKS